MSSNSILFNRNVIGLLLFINKEGEVISTDFTEVNKNYTNIKAIADSLLEAGILQVRSSPGHTRTQRWSITEYGMSICNLLCEAEKMLNATVRTEKYYKQ